MRNILTLAIVAGLAWYGYTKYQAASHQALVESISPVGGQYASANETDSASSFTCDGRTHCSQMTSCAEATYFIRHCPNTQMDGNNDGVPCERQWCR
ncbi:MAG: excalibur calcium-binding domain-containing protein [Steroidobacter sp.]